MFTHQSKYLLSIVTGLFMTILPCHAVTRVVAALPDLGSIASSIGGEKVEVSVIAKANSNPHSIEVFPSHMAKVSGARVYLKSGLGLDQWSDAIIDGSRNNKIVIVDCSNGVSVLEKPVHVDASMGDVHPFGNPHYWLNPQNGIVIAQNITDALKKVDPSNSATYDNNFITFKSDCKNRIKAWQDKMRIFSDSKIITYHSSWAYFADAFQLNIIEHVEPYPGIPPTGNHLAHLVNAIKKDSVVFILQEPYFSDDASKFLNRQTNVTVIKCSPSCEDVKRTSFFDHFDKIIEQISAIAGGK
ncbi:MAG TPA: metal ABC transporter substrate-binding protein [Chitinispirillaceae bacterium]|nr:metal ABC transporter substrate-binding protein [Chitinispirillaceae bacterium]